jgi:glycosyltransferase involved in cell wall biosynthesis
MKQNKFKIIIASYNNEQWVEYNLASILNQTYDNYEVIYIDDCSTDNTFQKAKEIIGDNEKFSIIKNETNLGGTYNHIRFFNDIEDEEILVLVDGDDWLFDDKVLEKLNIFYEEKNVWMTYGKFYAWNGEDATEAYPQNTAYDDFIHKHKYYRRDLWRSSHLRSYKGFLVKAIDKQDFVSQIDGKLLWHAGDLALAFPCLEMCPKEKIGVLDFPSYVYNASKISQERTSQRETSDNSKYEIEIRNKKSYKEGLTGEKLPQINVFYDNFELNNIPKKFTFCYNQEDGEFDLVILGDTYIVDYLEGRINIKKNVPIIARPFEDRNYWISKWGEPKIFNLLLKHYDKFDLILTLDKILLDKLPNTEYWPANYVSQFNILPNNQNIEPKKSIHWDSYEIPEDETYKIHHKTKLVSCVSSNKSFLPGHRTRLKFLEEIKKNPKIDIYGRGINPIDSKFDALKDYAFSIAIEMIKPGDIYHPEKQIWVDDEYYWSEKINDCFLTGTVPIYYGCPIIGNFFNLDGILVFNTAEELQSILDNLSMEQYIGMMPAIEDNLNRAKKYPLNSDDVYTEFFEKLINKKK